MNADIDLIDNQINALFEELKTTRSPIRRALIAVQVGRLATARNAAVRALAPAEFDTSQDGKTLYKVVQEQLARERRANGGG